MADAGIKKAVYQASKLPVVSLVGNPGSQELIYPIRYRVVSADGTETSAWSPIYEVPIRSFTKVDPNISVSSNGGIVSIVWDNPALKAGGANPNYFDIYVRWKDSSKTYLSGYSSYQYAGTQPSQPTYNLFTLRTPANAKYVDVVIQIATKPRQYFANAIIHSTNILEQAV